MRQNASVGWNRQLRLTPLTPRTYFRAKVITGYALAAVSIVLLCVAGLTLGVHLAPGRWATMIWLILIGLIPFAASRRAAPATYSLSNRSGRLSVG